MKKFYVLLFAFISMLLCLAILPANASSLKEAYAEATDELEPKETRERSVSSYDELRAFFLQQARFIGTDAPTYLHSVSYEEVFITPPPPRFYRLTGDYFQNLNLFNVGIGFTPVPYSPDAFGNFFLSARVGFGADDTELIYKGARAGADSLAFATIENLIGVEAEFEFGELASGLNFFAGVGLSHLMAEVDNSGVIFDPFLGLRYSFRPEGGYDRIGFQARAGWLFDGGVDNINTDASRFYFGGGVHLTSLLSFTSSGRAGLMRFESSILYSPFANTLFGQFTQPVELLDNLSLGFTGQIGTGIGASTKNELRTNTLLGLGVNLRLFGEDARSYYNPYIGYLYQVHGYDFDSGYEYGGISFFKIGNLLRLGRNSNWFIDLSIAAPISPEEPFVSDGPTNYSTPLDIDFNVGLTYKIGERRQRVADNYRGIIEIYDHAQARYLGESVIEPLQPHHVADQLIERRKYIQRTPEERPRVIPTVDRGILNIDASDFKMLRFTYEAFSSLDFTTHSFGDLADAPRDSLVLLVVMFDKERTDVNSIDNSNMSLVFTDLRRSRLFGFRHDINMRLQPEMREGLPLRPGTRDAYYGHFEKFVKPLKWLDGGNLSLEGSTVSGDRIQQDLLSYFAAFNEYLRRAAAEQGIEPYFVSQDQYRFAYVLYPKELLDEIQRTARDFGVSLMFSYHTKKEKTHNITDFFRKQGEEYSIDKDAAFYFSNIIHGSEIYSPEAAAAVAEEIETYDCNSEINIDRFGLGRDLLSYENMQKIYAAAQLYRSCPVTIVSGYTDRVEFANSEEFMQSIKDMQGDPIVVQSPSLENHLMQILDDWELIKQEDENALAPDVVSQRALAWRRIRSVLEEFSKWGVDLEQVEVDPAGIYPDEGSELHNPEHRKVIIRFK